MLMELICKLTEKMRTKVYIYTLNFISIHFLCAQTKSLDTHNLITGTIYFKARVQ